MGEQGGDKSEEPTPHRLREAREKGQVAKSKEITTAFLLLLSYGFFRFIGVFIWQELTTMATIIFSRIGGARDFSLSLAAYVMIIGLKAMIFAVGPIFIVVFLSAIIAEVLQTGFLFSMDPLSPKLEKLNPIQGLKKLFSLQGIVETIKSILKIVIVFYIAWSAAKEDLPFVVILIDAQPWDAMALGASIAFKIAMRVGVFYILIAILDYLYRRWEYMKNLKMTKQEVKEEYKRLEGDPMVKQRIRDMQRQISQQRMMAAVPQADVVVTNPTHLAVALKYDTSKMTAPLLLAKGQRLHAEHIKAIAEQHEISIVENEPLARSIYRTTKVNQTIPPELYQAVAEVLAWVYKLKKDRLDRSKRTLVSAPKG